VIISALFPKIPPIQSNKLVLHLGGIFVSVELVGSIPSYN
jgi:hypothetical protein